MAAGVLTVFHIRPRRRSRLSVRVTIFRTQRHLARHMKRVGCTRFRRIWAMCESVKVRDRRTKRLLPEAVRMYFHAGDGGLNANTVTHECFHAACGLAWRLGAEVISHDDKLANTRRRPAGTPDSVEEQCATTAGYLASRIYRHIYARGIRKP